MDPDYTSDAGWETYVSRFRADNPTMEVLQTQSMWEMRALTLVGYNDIWFAGIPYGPDAPDTIANYYRGKWSYYPDPSPDGMARLHFFSHTNGWGIDENRIYRFDGQNWTFWQEISGFRTILPCVFKSQTNVWAIGYYADTTYKGNVVLHYNGATWAEAFAPGENKYVYDVAMYNNKNGWAVGAEKVGSQSYGRIWQCLDGVWLERVCPVTDVVRGVEVVSNTEAWALTSGHILHYQTESNVAVTSLGRIKSLYAQVSGPDWNTPPSYASPLLGGKRPTAASAVAAPGLAATRERTAGAD